jgi:hypothetical protein
MRFCNVYLGPGREDEAYSAMRALKRLGGNWSVVADESLAQVLGHCSTPFEDLTDELTEDEVIETLTEALREQWPDVRVWFTEEDV